jgi:hypothetical protein
VPGLAVIRLAETLKAKAVLCKSNSSIIGAISD